MIRGKVIAIPATAFAAELKAAAGRVRDHARTTKIGANAVGNKMKSHFRQLNQKPNKNGWKKSDFWAQIRDSVQILAESGAAVVQINDPRFNLKFFGGTVTPKTAKLLAIPLQPEFAGVMPSTFPKDKFFFLPSRVTGGAGILAEHLGDNRARAAYLLTPKTTHAPQADALPPMDELRSIAVEAMKKFILSGRS